MDTVLNEYTEFEEEEIPVPLWMRLDTDEEDPLALPIVKTEECDSSEKVQCTKFIVPVVEYGQTSTISEDFQIKLKEEIHLEDSSKLKDFDNLTSTVPENYQIKSNEEFSSEKSVTNSLLQDIKVEKPSCSYLDEENLSYSYTNVITPKLEIFSEDNIEEQSTDLDVQSGEHRLTPSTASLPLSDQLEGGDISIKGALSGVSGGIAAINNSFVTSHGIAEISNKCKTYCISSCKRGDKEHLINKNLLCCAYCNFKTRNKQFLLSHKSKHINKTIMDQSLKKYHAKRTYSGHAKQYSLALTGKKIFHCNVCQYNTAYSSNLKKHILIHTGDKMYVCNICQYKCFQSFNLKQHILTHTGEKNYICNICQYKCSRSGHLKQHMLTHTGEKKYVCNICEYKCVESSGLKRHMVTHTGEKKYVCNICQYKFAQSGNLKQHLLTHTGEKKYVCSICEYKCSRSGHLKQHMLIHTGEKKFNCNICEYKCAVSGSLKRHMKTHSGKL